jgi:signal peptidase I
MEVLRKIYFFFLDTMQTILLAASIFLVVYIFFFRPFQVSGESMFPTYKNGEYILTNLISLRFSAPKQGDVIVFKAPTNEEKDFIKRVIGTAGDTVMLKEGSVYVNGKQMNESAYLNTDIKTSGGSFLQEGKTITVPENNYFVMGDNRPYSSDSREWGFLDQKNLIGKSFFVYWPLNTMRTVTNPYK